MTRNLNSAMNTEVGAPLIRPIILVKMEFDSGDLRLWSGIRPLTFNFEVYTGAGNLMTITPQQETMNMRAAGLTFTISGINAAAISVALAENYQGRTVTMWFGALDANENIVDAPFQQFKGELDVMTLEDDGTTATISVNAENELVALERPRVRRFSDEDQELDYPNDRFFEFVPGLVEKEIILE